MGALQADGLGQAGNAARILFQMVFEIGLFKALPGILQGQVVKIRLAGRYRSG